jgi:hypothetical protein
MLGQYGASSCPMPASSGFQSSPEHTALGHAVCIAAIETTSGQGASFVIVDFVINNIRS